MTTDRAKKLEKLAIDHAYWSEQKTIHHEKMRACYDDCDGIGFDDSRMPAMFFGESCTQLAIKITNQLRSECPDDFIEFIDVFNGHYETTDGDEFEACDSCKKARKHRKQKAYASRRLGQVRAAITRIGRNLQK